MKRITVLSLSALLCACSGAHGTASSSATNTAKTGTPKNAPQVVTLESPSPLIAIKVMIRAGSTADPQGKEGLAHLVARALIEGAFGNADAPTTKEALAERVQPWGEGAMPRAYVAGRTTTFSMTVPRDVLPAYIEQVLSPMFRQPLFQASELDRLRSEMTAQIANMRHETLEGLGLAALDAYVNEGTRYTHPAFGTESSLPQLIRDDVQRFYATFYRPDNTIVGISTSDSTVVDLVVGALRALPNSGGAVPQRSAGTPAVIKGRNAVVIVEPNAPAAAVHLGFPLRINRTHDDFWPLYVAQVWFGTHRDSSGHLYQEIRQARGYNYGNYAYLEHWNGKPSNLFQVFNQPREQQYFSIWIRPVGYEHAHHIAKAATWELDRLIHKGLTDEQVEEGKKKARVLYLNLAETVDRLLAAKMDDAFYGMSPGFLDGYIDRIDRVTPAAVNAAIQKHLQVDNLKYVLVTNAEHGDDLVSRLRQDGPAYGKSPADYELRKTRLKDGLEVWQIPDEKLQMLRVDALWAHYPLRLSGVRKTPVQQLFKTGAFIAE